MPRYPSLVCARLPPDRRLQLLFARLFELCLFPIKHGLSVPQWTPQRFRAQSTFSIPSLIEEHLLDIRSCLPNNSENHTVVSHYTVQSSSSPNPNSEQTAGLILLRRLLVANSVVCRSHLLYPPPFTNSYLGHTDRVR